MLLAQGAAGGMVVSTLRTTWSEGAFDITAFKGGLGATPILKKPQIFFIFYY